jgi:GH24 family phage-related lysozyme (muramidase)
MTVTQASERGLAFCAAREACVLKAYLDTKHLAIGFGDNDPSLKEGDTISFEEAIRRYLKKIKGYEESVNRIFAAANLSQTTFDALISLCWNVGATQLREEKQLITAIEGYGSDPKSAYFRDWAAFELIKVKLDGSGPFNLSRRCREALVLINGDYGDLNTLKIWPPYKTVRVDPPDITPMPRFLRD